jgi:hypothetical protein
MATQNTRNALADPRGEMQAATRKNMLMGYLADALTAASDYTQRPDERAGFGDQYSNPPLAYGANMLGLPAIANTAQRLSYGEPLTTGAGMTTQMRPDTADAAMAVAPVVAKFPRATLGAVLGLMGATGDAGAGAKAIIGALPRNNLGADYLKGLISSQRYLDRDLVAQKIKARDFDVRVTPDFEIDGDTVRAIQDGHHALEAAIRSGNRPNFIINSATDNDRVGLINSGKIDQFLDAAYHDSPWYNFATKRDIF